MKQSMTKWLPHEQISKRSKIRAMFDIFVLKLKINKVKATPSVGVRSVTDNIMGPAKLTDMRNRRAWGGGITHL